MLIRNQLGAAVCAGVLLTACTGDALTPEMKSAVEFCHLRVKDQLRSPLTARFADNYRGAVSEVGEGEYRIESWVESKNAFDSWVGHDYWCQVRREGGDWTEVELAIDWDTDWVVE